MAIVVTKASTVTGKLLEVNFTSDYVLTKVELTIDGENYILANSFTQTSALFTVDNLENGTYENCYIRGTVIKPLTDAGTGGGSGSDEPSTGGGSGSDEPSTGGGSGSDEPGTGGGDEPTSSVLFDHGLIEGYTITQGANFTVGEVISLTHGANTYFGFDQSVLFNAGDSISFVIETCNSDAVGYVTRVCYLDDSNILQGYATAVGDDVVSANLPYTLTHTFESTTAVKPALMKYFGSITISNIYITRA